MQFTPLSPASPPPPPSETTQIRYQSRLCPSVAKTELAPPQALASGSPARRANCALLPVSWSGIHFSATLTGQPELQRDISLRRPADVFFNNHDNSSCCLKLVFFFFNIGH
ncbi:unnamed protein product [Protopolystoma xenopodis]|uniref:Uncharacterized protein n=1 Tax=Protopolystoma xenopodis TaxID=117903 RepID=A0A3S5C3A9_9PLAT|nr:unnamed protein product [Protopolystoma xenopodis]